jgi:hypothetical protein
MNLLETQLRSWTPRHPSPGIERQLFARVPFCFTIPRLVTAFAPAAACLMLTLAGLQHYGKPLSPAYEPQAEMIAMSLSNQSVAPYLAGNGQCAANRVATFEWTNRGCSQSSVSSFTPTKAIDLQ